jgi:hypothetical protein
MHELIADLEKHPLIANGGPLKVGMRAPEGAATILNMPNPALSAAAGRAPTPPPVMGRTSPVVTPTNIRPGSAGGSVAPQSSAPITPTHPADAAPAAAAVEAPAQTAAAVARHSYWPIGMFVVALAIATAVWMYRAQISNAIAGNAPERDRVLSLWERAEQAGAGQIGPILRQLNIDLPPVLVFDGLVALVVLLLLRNMYAHLVRARNRRAYARKQARGAS